MIRFNCVSKIARSCRVLQMIVEVTIRRRESHSVVPACRCYQKCKLYYGDGCHGLVALVVASVFRWRVWCGVSALAPLLCGRDKKIICRYLVGYLKLKVRYNI